METTIVSIIFAMLCINLPMALRYWLMYDFEDKRNQKWVKWLQVVNAVASIVLVSLVVMLFDKLACGYNINW